jgi:hypothetical protein
MGSAHLITIVESLPAIGGTGCKISNLAVGIPEQEIEWAQVRVYGPKSIEAFLSGTARRPLVRQDDSLGPIGQSHAGEQPGSGNHFAAATEFMLVDVNRGYRVATQYALFQPRLIASGGHSVVVAAAPEVHAFDLANAELGALGWLRGNVVRWSDERTDRAGTPGVEADPV